MSVLSWLAIATVVVLVGVSLEVMKARRRRQYVEAFVASQGLRLVTCRQRWRFSDPKHLATYDVEVEDSTGHRTSGVAYATGALRRKAWIEW